MVIGPKTVTASRNRLNPAAAGSGRLPLPASAPAVAAGRWLFCGAGRPRCRGRMPAGRSAHDGESAADEDATDDEDDAEGSRHFPSAAMASFSIVVASGPQAAT